MKNNKKWILLAALVLMFTVTVGGTLAYLIDKTESVENTFTPSTVDITVEDKVDGLVKSDVVISVGGNTEVYVRAAIVGNWCDASGNIVRPWKITDSNGSFEGLAGSNWDDGEDGYYYYKKPVAPNAKLSAANGNALFTKYTVTSIPEGADHLELTILTQAIQSQPISAVVEKWGVTVASDGKTISK